MPSDAEEKPIRRVERLLERLFASGALGEGNQEEASAAPRRLPQSASPELQAAAAPPSARLVGEGPARALLTVDDAGDFLLCAGREIVLGHARAGRADLPVLADVGPRHARFVLCASLAGGEEWRLQPLGTERVFRNAEPVSTAAALADLDELRLGKNLELTFHLPDLASASAVLTFRRGVDCLGAAHVVLFAAGPGGRIRLGAAAGRHVRVPNLLSGAELVLADGRLSIASEAGVASAAAGRTGRLEIAFPPPARVDIQLGKGSADGRPPFSFSLSPVQENGAGEGS